VTTHAVLESERTAPRPFGRLTLTATSKWWLALGAGIAWLVVSIMILRFDSTTVTAVAVWFGVVTLLSAGNEVLVSSMSTPGWRIVHRLVALLFAVVGVLSFIHPGNTFVALAALVSFYLILRGALDLGVALAASVAMRGWWLLVVVAVAELLLGFWAAGSWNLSVAVLVGWVGAIALTRGITEILVAFELRELNQAARNSAL
jgi:uncharacterized membrane protein HdeD (DUF308 family)